MIKLGAHQSIAGGYSQALKRINDIGGNCLQIFSSSPRGWNFAKENKEEIKKFVYLKNKLSINPIYFHASYLVNLANNSRIGYFSKTSLISEMRLAPFFEIKGSIVHLGSYKQEKSKEKYNLLIKNIKEILNKTPKDSLFIIENAGNRKIGQNLEEISQIINDIGNPRIRLCLDTCHLFANGYQFKTKKELDNFLDQLNQLNLLNKLELWHLNDSRDPLNSGKDRHANIGQGTIGIEEFEVLLNHPQTENYPFIIETPGFDNKGPDKKNLDILKSLILV